MSWMSTGSNLRSSMKSLSGQKEAVALFLSYRAILVSDMYLDWHVSLSYTGVSERLSANVPGFVCCMPGETSDHPTSQQLGAISCKKLHKPYVNINRILATVGPV